MGNNISNPPSQLKVMEKLVSHTPNAHAPTTHIHDKVVEELIEECKNDNNKSDICEIVNSSQIKNKIIKT